MNNDTSVGPKFKTAIDDPLWQYSELCFQYRVLKMHGMNDVQISMELGYKNDTELNEDLIKARNYIQNLVGENTKEGNE